MIVRLRAWLRRILEVYTMSTYRKALAMSDDEKKADSGPQTVPMPSVGVTVLYTTPDGNTWPAIVSEVDLMQPSVCGLTIFGMGGPSIADVVQYDDAGGCGTWRWPGFARRAS